MNNRLSYSITHTTNGRLDYIYTNTHTEAALNDYVGGNANGVFTVSNLPLDLYGANCDFLKSVIIRIIEASNYINNGSAIVNNGAEFGKLVYKTSKGVKTAAVFSNIAKITKFAGIAGVGLNVGCTALQMYNDYIPWQEGMIRLGITGVEFGLNFVPYVGPLLSITLTAYDVSGGFDNNLYNTEKWWKGDRP